MIFIKAKVDPSPTSILRVIHNIERALRVYNVEINVCYLVMEVFVPVHCDGFLWSHSTPPCCKMVILYTFNYLLVTMQVLCLVNKQLTL